MFSQAWILRYGHLLIGKREETAGTFWVFRGLRAKGFDGRNVGFPYFNETGGANGHYIISDTGTA